MINPEVVKQTEKFLQEQSTVSAPLCEELTCGAHIAVLLIKNECLK